MTDKKQEMVSNMSISELNQLISRLETDLVELGEVRNKLKRDYLGVVATKEKLSAKWKKLAHELEKVNNDYLLKAVNEKRELLIEQLAKQGIFLTPEFEDFICSQSENIVISDDVILLSKDICEDLLPEMLSGTGAVLFSGTINLPNKKCSKLLSNVVSNNDEIESQRQELGFYDISCQLDGAKQEYALATAEGHKLSGRLSYYDTIIAEKDALLAYCSERIGTSSISTNKQKSIGVMPVSSKGNQ